MSNTKITTLAYASTAWCSIETMYLPVTLSSIGSGAFSGVSEASFPNGKNSSLTIPDDKWGATKITVSGVEYVPGT